MSEQTGAQIKEARLAAGMTQKELAEAVDGLSARSVSEAERGLRELTAEQLAAIAEVTGAESLLPDVDQDESPEVHAEDAPVSAGSDPAEDAPVSAGSEMDILKLINEVDPAVKAAALSVLKGETRLGKGLLDTALPMVVEMLGGDKDANPLMVIIGFLGSEQGKAFLDTLQGVLGNVAGMFSGVIGDTDQDGKGAPGSLLIFTFLYAVAIYVLLLSFYFWQIRTDIKPEK